MPSIAKIISSNRVTFFVQPRIILLPITKVNEIKYSGHNTFLSKL